MLSETSEAKFHGGISAAAVKAHARELLAIKATIEHDDVFQTILDKLPKDFDFLAAAGLKDGDKLTLKHYIVLTVQEITKTAHEINAGICRNLDFVYVFNGQFWRQCDEDELVKFLGEAAEKLGVPAMTARYFQTRDNLLKQFRSTAYLPQPKRKEGVTLLNCRNGTFEIGTAGQRLREFRREDFLTYQLPFAYDPQAVCPKWTAFLNRNLPDTSRQHVCAEFIAWCFTDLKLEKAMFLYGEGANGKSVFFEVMTAVLGEENVTHYSIASLSDDKGYQRAKIADALLNYASEIGTKVESEHFKKMVSREPVEARLPYGKPFLLKRYARLAFNANELPRDVEHNTAFFRRFLVIPFDVTIPKAERNKTLHTEIITAELSGVFNWVLAGLARLLRQTDFSHCDAAEKALEDYQRESDSVALFLDEQGYRPSTEGYQPLGEVYKAYREFANDCGYRPVSKINFGKRLKTKGFSSERYAAGMRVWLGRE